MSPTETLTVNPVKATTRKANAGYEVCLPFKSDERPPPPQKLKFACYQQTFVRRSCKAHEVWQPFAKLT